MTAITLFHLILAIRLNLLSQLETYEAILSAAAAVDRWVIETKAQSQKHAWMLKADKDIRLLVPRIAPSLAKLVLDPNRTLSGETVASHVDRFASRIVNHRSAQVPLAYVPDPSLNDMARF